MEIAYYPGCSLHSTGKGYDASIKYCMQNLGVELTEVYDWNCCGATSAHSLNGRLSVLLSGRNMTLVKKMSLSKIFAPCAACYNRMVVSQHRMQQDPALEREIREELPDLGDPSEVKILSILDLLGEPELQERLKSYLRVSLRGLRVACYYGCYLVRPTGITGQREAEDPMLLENILETAQAEPVRWVYKTECCGAGMVLPRPEIVLRLSGDILRDAKRAGADVIATVCPLCQMNLDTRQDAIARETGERLEIPVVFITQLLGLAMGGNAGRLGLKGLMVNPYPVLRRREIV